MNLFSKKTVDITREEERLISAMQLLGDKNRYKIFKLLMSHDEMCVTEIADELKITVSAISQQFRNFELLGRVDKERMGQKICYTLRSDDDLVSELIKVANKRKS